MVKKSRKDIKNPSYGLVFAGSIWKRMLRAPALTHAVGFLLPKTYEITHNSLLMDYVFAFTFFASIIILFFLIPKPTVFPSLIKSPTQQNRLRKVFGVSAIVSFILLSFFVSPKEENVPSSRPTIMENKVATSSGIKINEESEILSYKIIHTDTKTRYDGGVIYYLLIDPIGLESNFKEDLRNMIKTFSSAKGKKISIEIFDKKEALDLYYKQYVDKSLNRPRSNQEEALLEQYYVASFSGELDTGIYKNSLTYFPGAFTSSSVVGKYVETVEFNP